MKLWERVDYSAIVDRPPLRLPAGNAVAVWPLVTVEVWDPDGPMPRTVLTPPQGSSFIPDVPNWSWAEYGVRVGFWRMKAALDARGLKANFCINASVIERYPRVCEAALEAGWEFMGHNIVQKPMHAMDDEAAAIEGSVAAIAGVLRAVYLDAGATMLFWHPRRFEGAVRHDSAFRHSLKDAVSHSRFDDTAAEGDIERYVKEFEVATDRLKDHFSKKQTASGDAEEVLRRGAAIDGFMRRFSLSSRAQSDWSALRGNLDELARAYGVTWNW